MGSAELFIIAIGLSMDAFAVAICRGLSLQKLSFRNVATVGAYFGVFQALMPLIGYLLGVSFAERIEAVDHWIAFILLALIGGKMIYDSIKESGCEEDVCQSGEAALQPSIMFPSAIATSIDALAVGVSFAFLHVNILPAITTIGITTLVVSMVGVCIGKAFGTKFKSKAEFVGGVILVFMGIKILLEHTGIL